MSGGILSKSARYIREIVFGLEDSFVSTLGAVTGIAAGVQNGEIVLLSGVVLVAVESISMAAGSYLSSKSAKEAFEYRSQQDGSRLLQEPIDDDGTFYNVLLGQGFSVTQIDKIVSALKRERRLWLHEVERCERRLIPAVSGSAVISGIVMGFFYLVGGSIPLAPYLFFPLATAMYFSLVLTGVGLFLLGILKAKVVGGHLLKSGIEMTTVALTAALLGYIIGRLLSLYFGII